MLLLLSLVACTPDEDEKEPVDSEDSPAAPDCDDGDGDGYCVEDGDCDDGNPAINPGAAEVCDPDDVDEDCSGDADDADPDVTGQSTWYLDGDADTYGSDKYTRKYCNEEAGWVAIAGDCDDADATVNPAAAEVCDAADKDEDCDGLVDDADDSVTGGTTWYGDGDGDGFGGDSTTTTACDPPVGYAADASDCDDAVATTFPGAPEACEDGVDNDCNGRIDACDAGVEVSIPTVAARIVGDNADDGLSGIFPLGDVNADGVDDLGIAATGIDHTGTSAGAAAVFYGPYAGEATFAEADAVVYGGAAGDRFGTLCAAGDLVGDTTGDLVCGGPGAAKGAGGAWVFAGPLAAEGTTAAATSVVQVATPGSGLGSILLVGDYSGDGLDDLVVGGPTIQTAWRFDGPLTAATYDETGGTASWREGGIGRSPLATIGADLDGDGILDLAFGDEGEDGNNGAVWIAYGGATGDLNLSSNSDASILGTRAGKLGSAVSGGGDADGDGYTDLAVGASATDGTGAVHLFLGPFGEDIDDGAAVVSFSARATGSGLGAAIAWGADLDGDTLPDLAMGQAGDSEVGSGAGSVCVAYGPLNWSGSLDAADLIYLAGAGGDAAGTSVATADIDADGIPNLLIASPGADSSISNVGAIDLVD